MESNTPTTENKMSRKENQYLENHARLMDAIESLKRAADSLPSPEDDYSWGDVETMGYLAASAESIISD